MKALWTQEQAAFKGEFVNLEPSWAWPKPVQKPHPPILMGGETDHTLRRVVAYCDGWFPRATPKFDPKEAVGRLRQMASTTSRDFKSLSITVFRAPADQGKLAQYADAGIGRALLEIPDLSRDEILRHLDKLAPLAA